MVKYFVNLPLRYIHRDSTYLEYFMKYKLNPELGMDAISIDNIDIDWHKKTAEKIEKNGLVCSIHLPFHDLQPGSIDDYILEATRKRLLSALSIAKIYNPKFLVAHANFIPLYLELFSKWLKRAVETWEMVADNWPDHPPIYLENVREYDPRPLADLFSELSHLNIKFCFDVGHWSSYSGGLKLDNMSTWIQVMAPYLRHLHLHDNDGVKDEHFGLGVGCIPWVELFAGLELLDLSPTFTLEPHTKDDLEHSWKFIKKHTSWFGRLGIKKSSIPDV